jgi:PST family polysaccharide transporter
MNDLVSSKKHKLFQGALLLSIAGLFSKILGAAYRIPYQNIAGDIGYYIYQQVYPFLGISVMFATAGFPVILSKIVNQHEESNRGKVLSVAFLYMLSIGLIFFFILFFGADWIAGSMADPNLAFAIRISAFPFLLFPFLSYIRGFFQGGLNMLPTAISQMSEQFTRVFVIILFSYFLIANGSSLYDAAAGAVSGSLIGGLAALTVLLHHYRKHAVFNRQAGRSTVRALPIVRELVVYTFTICTTSLLFIMVQFIDAMNLNALLLENGSTPVGAKILKGVYDRGQPLLQLGGVFATSIASALVPTLSAAAKTDEKKKKIRFSLKASAVVGAGASAGLICILKPVNIMLFQNSEGTDALQIFSLSILFASLALTSTAVFQGLGMPVIPAVAVLIGTCAKLVFNVLFIPEFGIKGAALATVLSFASVAGLNFVFLRKKGWLNLTKDPLFSLLVSTLSMSIILICFTYLFEWIVPHESRWMAAIESFSAVGIGGCAFLYMVLKRKMFSSAELGNIPFVKKFIKLEEADESGR